MPSISSRHVSNVRNGVEYSRENRVGAYQPESPKLALSAKEGTWSAPSQKMEHQYMSVHLWLSLVLCAGALADNDVLPVGDPQLGRVLLVKMEDVQILK